MVISTLLFLLPLAVYGDGGVLLNEDQDCWQPCTKTQGPCDFCGNGLCCRWGWHVKSGGCDGTLGIEGKRHVCVAKPGCSDVKDRKTCVKTRRGECMWDGVKCMDFVPPPKPVGCQCSSDGDPHIRPFCSEKKDKKCDHFLPGEYVQFKNQDLEVQVRSELAPRRDEVTANTAMAWTGNWVCGNTYELHIGSHEGNDKWSSPTTFEPRLIVHDASYMNDRDNWKFSSTNQHVGAAAIVAALRDDPCPMFSFEGGVNFSEPDNKEELKLNFWDGSFIDLKQWNHPFWGISFVIHLQTHIDADIEGLCKEVEGPGGADACQSPRLECPTLFTYYIDEDMPWYTNSDRKGEWTYQLPAGVMGDLTEDMANENAYCGNLPARETPAPIAGCSGSLQQEAVEHCKECEDENMRKDCEFDVCLEGNVSGGDAVLHACIGYPKIPTEQPTLVPSFSPTKSPFHVAEPTPEPPQGCIMAEWSAWEECTVSCGEGVEWKVRHVDTPAAPGGASCPDETEISRPCWMGVCPAPTKNPTPNPTPTPTKMPTIDCTVFAKWECKHRQMEHCVWDDDKGCTPRLPQPAHKQGECKSHGDPHVRPFGNAKASGGETWDFFMHGEWDQYTDAPRLIVHSRTEWAPRRSMVTANTGFAFTGEWLCGKTFEFHAGSVACKGVGGGCPGGWRSPTVYDPVLLVHGPAYAGNKNAWNPQTTNSYTGVDDINQGFKDELSSCNMVSKVQASNKPNKEFVTITFKDGSKIDFKEYNKPFWGMAFFLHIKDIKDDVTGLCREGMENSAPDSLTCDDNLFNYYPDSTAKQHVFHGYQYHQGAPAYGPWDPATAKDETDCLAFPRPENGWVPAPIEPCDEDLKKQAEAYCARCPDKDLAHDCVFDICISGVMEAGDPVINTCLNQPETPTYSPTKLPTYADEVVAAECGDHKGKVACTGQAGCKWTDSIAAAKYPACTDEDADACNNVTNSKKCGKISKCTYDKGSKKCITKPILTGCAAFEDKKQCKANGVNGCKYAGGKCSGTFATPAPETGCAANKSKGNCAKVLGCRWKKSKCSGTPIPDTVDETSCPGNKSSNTCGQVAGCRWKKNKCTGTPSGGGDETGCGAEKAKGTCHKVPGCRWKKNKCSGTPLTGCAVFTKKTCNKQAGCKYVAKKCIESAPAPVPTEPPAERKCTVTEDFPKLTGQQITAKRPVDKQEYDVEGLDEADATCMCYEKCTGLEGMAFWNYYAKNGARGKCTCYTGKYKSLGAGAGQGSCGGIGAVNHAKLL